MATKSDFAQKLLTDLRLRKERMAAAQNSSRQSGQTSRVVHGNPGRTSRGARQINAVESAGSRTGNTSRMSNGGSRSINIKESSNQIVLYESRQSSRQVRDLSMAIAFAFENSGNLSKIGVSSSNPLVNFFQRFGPRSLHSQKMDLTSFNSHSLSSGQFPTISHIHINEISKGVQKLNQILRACSDGLNFDRNSIEVGKQLLKGAIDLEESLRMLVNLQEASKYGNGAQKKSRIKLLEEDEDDQDDNHKTTDQWKLDRPRFSFDKPSRNARFVQGATRLKQQALSYPGKNSEQPIGNSEMVLHRRSTSYVQDLSLSTQVKLSSNVSSSQTAQEKGRISNVIAKLMGLEETPQKEDSIRMKNDVKEKEGKQGKVLRKNSKSSDTLNRENRSESLLSTDKRSIQTNNTPPVRDSKLKLKVEKIQENPDGSSKLVNSERNQQRKDLKLLGVGMEAVPGPKLASTMMKKQQNHAIAPNQVNGLQSFEDSEKKQNLKKEKESKIIESGSKVLVLNTEPQQKAENGKTLKAEERRHNRIEYKVSSNSTEKRNADKGLLRSQQKPQDQHLLLQERVIRRSDHSEDKCQADQKDQQIQKQNMTAKNHEGQQVESGVASKSKKSTAINLQKKLSREKSAPCNGRSAKTIEKVPVEDPPNGRHPDVASMIDISNKTASNQENFKKENQSHYSSPREPQPDIEKESSNPVHTKEKQIEVSATQKKAIPQEVQRNEIPRKIDALMSRRNTTASHLTRPIKQPANMLKGLKQQMHIKNRSSKRMEEESDGQVKEGKTGIRINNASEMTTESVRQEDKLQNEADQMIISNNSVADECQIQNIQITSTLNGNCDSTILNPGKVSDDLQIVEKPYALKDENRLKQRDQSIGDNEESTEPYNLSQHDYKQCPASTIQEQLTEPEKDLKEILIKSQLFLSTAEALFKLNIPVSCLHVGDHDYEVAEKKLVLDTAYEVMKRKARRYEVTYHPYTKTNISCTKLRSLDNLVKQLCKELEILKFYGGHGNDVAAGLYEMLNKDIYNEGPDVNSIWDFEWSNMMSMFPEKEEVIREVERHMINGLLDEITNDLVIITVSV